MAWDMGRKLALGLSWFALACSDDAAPAVTAGDETTSGDVTGPSDVSDTFESVSLSNSDSITDATFSEVGPDATTFDPSDTFETDSDPTFTTIDTFDTSSSVTDSDTNSTSTTDSSTTDPTIEPTTDPTIDPTTTDPTVTDPTTTDPTIDPTDATDTDTDTDSDTDGGGFDEPPVFGTNPLDFDLVGVWGLNWEPESGFDSVLDVDDAGNFMWTETSADCSTSTVASGVLWVEGSQVVMHVELWDRQLPWDTEAVLGESFEPPFRVRMSYSLQGSGADDYLTFAAPGRITEGAPYSGESYVQLDAEGEFLAGSWHGEAQLEAIPAGEIDPVVVVRDSYDADLGLEFAADDPQGFGTRSITTQYFLPVGEGTQSTVFLGGNWGCLDGCPDASGLTLVNGGNLYTYGPYGAQQHLLSFATGRTFRSNVASDCP
ncbi:MAG: hypothetical protein IAG13_30045 [Deltaproteobacteria bacterium]|nr:hypothetical protein [Nannocystaceae bacterium]